MTTKKQMIKLLEQREKQRAKLNELEARINDLDDKLFCGTELQNCSNCGEQMIVKQRMTGLVCRECADKFKAQAQGA